MRAKLRVVAALRLAGLVWMGVTRASAQEPPSVIEIAELPRLRAGEVGAVVVRVRIPAASEQPLLLTPAVEGQALQVVRGRLLREDASARTASELRFEVPVVAREAGTALLRVELWTYRCDPRCELVRAEVRKVLQVHARGSRT